jgi:hypothetical protein
MPEARRERRILGRILAPEDLFVIAGPCVLEGEAMALEIAWALKEATQRHGAGFIFKASYRKDNRSDVASFTGPGDREGLEILARVRDTVGVPVLTDVHGCEEVAPAAEVCACLQVPAFLSRQTRLLQAAARASRSVNVKKGQFLAPDDMRRVVEKLRAASREVEVWLTERGTTFGYHNLVVDLRGIALMSTREREGTAASPCRWLAPRWPRARTDCSSRPTPTRRGHCRIRRPRSRSRVSMPSFARCRSGSASPPAGSTAPIPWRLKGRAGPQDQAGPRIPAILA